MLALSDSSQGGVDACFPQVTFCPAGQELAGVLGLPGIADLTLTAEAGLWVPGRVSSAWTQELQCGTHSTMSAQGCVQVRTSWDRAATLTLLWVRTSKGR